MLWTKISKYEDPLFYEESSIAAMMNNLLKENIGLQSSYNVNCIDIYIRRFPNPFL